MPFNMEQAKADIRSFNSSLPYLAGDYLLHQCFPGGDYFREDATAVCVRLVDALWSTGVNREGTVELPEDRTPLSRLSAHLKERFGDITETLIPLQNADVLANNSDIVYEQAEPALRMILETPGLNYTPLSFASKLLHWLAPQNCPPTDTRADKGRKALRPPYEFRLARDERDGRTAEKLHKYHRWVTFYGKLLSDLEPVDQEELVEHDFRTQEETSPALAKRNTVLRVLDKHLWIRGGEPQAD